MAEPTSTSAGISITVLSMAMLGPLAGPYAVILFASLAGALWPLSASETTTRVAGALLLLRCMLTAVVLTVFLANIAQRLWGVPVIESLAPVALFIGALGNGWRPVFMAFGTALGAAIEKLGGKNRE